MSTLPSPDDIRFAVETLFDTKADVSQVYQMMSTVFHCRLESGLECYLKTAPTDEIASCGWILRERTALKILSRYDLDIPRLLSTHEDLLDWRWGPCVITERVPGIPLDRLETAEDRPAAFRGMGQWLASLQIVKPADLVTPYGEGGRIVVAGDLVPFSDTVVETTEMGRLNDLYRPTQWLVDTLEVTDEFGWFPDLHRSLLTEENYGIVHGDYTPRHFFYDQGKVMGLDLMTLSVGFPFRDLGKARAHALWNDRTDDHACYEWIVEGYTDGQGLSENQKVAADVGFVAEALELALHRSGNPEAKQKLIDDLTAIPDVKRLSSI